MNEVSFNRDRLEELLFASVNNSFSVEERDELNAMLRGSSAARSFAAQFLSIDAVLAEGLGTSEAELRYSVQEVKTASKQQRFPLRGRVWVAVAAMAAAVLIGVFSWKAVTGNRKPVVDPDSLVQVVEPVGFVQSVSRTTAFKSGDTFQRGDWVRFEKGRVVVKFESGAKLAVEGPADFQIVSNNGALMIRGQATIRVPGKIKGFTLDTPSEQIVDLGTSFGVKVEHDGTTSIAVFEGEVELRGQQHKSGHQQLAAGKSLRVESRNNSINAIPHDVTDYLQTWQTSFGVEAIEGAMRIAEPSERAVPGKVVDEDQLLVFPERESVKLPAGFVCSATEPGAYHSPKGLKQQIALGAPVVVDSYLIQFNPGPTMKPGTPLQFAGTLIFDRPVVGLLFRSAMLDESDAILGLPSADFGGVFRRGINAGDQVTLRADRRTLDISFDVFNGVDQIRVLVASGPN